MVARIANSQEVINRKKKQESKQRKGGNSNQDVPSTLSRRNLKENEGKKIDFRGEDFDKNIFKVSPNHNAPIDHMMKHKIYSLMTINPTGEK